MSRHDYRVGPLLVLLLLINTLPAAPAADGEIVAREPNDSRGTIVVNASGGGDYTRIQWAVDNASEGDTVYVEAGTYYENIEINKTISLIGADRGNTTVVGIEMADAIRISADGVIVSGFHINNSASEYNCSVHLFRADNCRIENVIVSDSRTGILVGGSDNNTVIDNIVRDNRHGIYLDYAENNTIVQNMCSDNKYGLNVVFSERNVIDNNIVNSNDFGIVIDSSANNTVSNNTAYFNKWSGITLNIMSATLMSDISYERYKTRYNQIIENFCESNNDSGIEVSSSDYNNVSQNTCILNFKSGISVSSSENCLVEINSCISNTYGIYFSDSISSTIMNNICLSNLGFGIFLNTSCENNTVYGNDLLQNNFGNVQGADNGIKNWWNNSHSGNHWSDWTSPDSNNNSIVDVPYNISGSANSIDFLPLAEPVNELLPNAEAGPDATINQGESVIFDGSGSWGYPSINNYRWSFIYANTTMLLYGPFQSFTFHIPGTYLVTLVVTDSIGRKDTDTMTITVIDNVGPIANAGPDDTIERLETYELNGSLSTDNVGITGYSWSFYYEPEWITLEGISRAFTFSDAGVYHITLTVTDLAGNQANDTMVLTVVNRDADKYVIVDSSGQGDYRRIWEGIENISVGGTVFVRAGTYEENLIIDKTISLVGVGREFVTIKGNGNDNVVEIMADWVNLSGFEITNGLSYDLDNGGSGICINPNYHTGNQYYVRDNHCQIENNSCTGNRYGVYAKYSHRNFIMNNILTSNHHGIFLNGDSNNIERNNCSHNNVGIELHGAYDSIIIDNTCNSNSRDGIKLDDSCINTITGNKCNNNGDMGISIGTADHWECEYNKCYMNICNNNTNGIKISGDSDHNQIADNLCDSNELYGIYFYGSKQKDWRYNDDRWITDYPEKTLIENNTCRNNDIGIYFTFSNYNDLTHNRFISNKEYGIYMDADSHDNVIHHNNFVLDISSGSQAYDNGVGNSWDDGSEGNYWSDYTTRYPDAVRVGDVWDTPYEIGDGGRCDNYPLHDPIQFLPITPTAVVGQDVEIELNGTVLFDSTGSLDDMGIVNYTWTFLYDGKQITLTGPTPNFTFKIPGTYGVTLTVTDAQGNVGMDVTVLPDGVVPSSDDDPEDDDGEGPEKGGGIVVGVWLIAAVLVVGVIVVLVLCFWKNKGGDEDVVGEDELGRVGKEDRVEKNG